MLVLTNLCTVWHSVTVFHRKSFGLQLPGSRPGQAITASQLGFISSSQPAARTLRPNKQLWHLLPLCFSPASLTSSTSLAHAWLVFGWAGHNRERERESPVWVCALLVEPDLARAGQSHTVTLLENIDNKPFYILLLQLLSIIAPTLSVRLEQRLLGQVENHQTSWIATSLRRWQLKLTIILAKLHLLTLLNIVKEPIRKRNLVMRIEYKCWEKIIIKSLFLLLMLFICSCWQFFSFHNYG